MSDPITQIEILWITAGMGCDGDTIAMTVASQPGIEDIFAESTRTWAGQGHRGAALAGIRRPGKLMKDEGESPERPEIPFDFEGIDVLLNLARSFMPDFALPGLATQPPPLAGATEEVRVRKAEARYQALVEQIPAVTFLASFENGLSEIYVSPHIEALLGYTAREWIDDPILWYQRLHPADKMRWNKEFSRTVSLAEPFKADYRFLAKDGRVVWIHGEAKVVRDESGRPSFVQGLGYDITELKNAEEVLRAIS